MERQHPDRRSGVDTKCSSRSKVQNMEQEAKTGGIPNGLKNKQAKQALKTRIDVPCLRSRIRSQPISPIPQQGHLHPHPPNTRQRQLMRQRRLRHPLRRLNPEHPENPSHQG